MKSILCKLFGHKWRTFENPDSDGYKIKNWSDGKECERCKIKEYYDY